MSNPRVLVDSLMPEAPIRLEMFGTTLHLTTKEGQALYELLGGVLMQLDPADSEPPLAADNGADDEPTIPSTPVARRISSQKLEAVKGLAGRVDAILAEGREP